MFPSLLPRKKEKPKVDVRDNGMRQRHALVPVGLRQSPSAMDPRNEKIGLLAYEMLVAATGI